MNPHLPALRSGVLARVRLSNAGIGVWNAPGQAGQPQRRLSGGDTAMVVGGKQGTGHFPAIGQRVDVVLPTGRRSTDRTTFTGTVTQIVGDTVLVTFEQPYPVAFIEGKIERLGFTWMPIDQVKPHPAGQ